MIKVYHKAVIKASAANTLLSRKKEKPLMTFKCKCVELKW